METFRSKVGPLLSSTYDTVFAGPLDEKDWMSEVMYPCDNRAVVSSDWETLDEVPTILPSTVCNPLPFAGTAATCKSCRLRQNVELFVLHFHGCTTQGSAKL